MWLHFLLFLGGLCVVALVGFQLRWNMNFSAYVGNSISGWIRLRVLQVGNGCWRSITYPVWGKIQYFASWLGFTFSSYCCCSRCESKCWGTSSLEMVLGHFKILPSLQWTRNASGTSLDSCFAIKLHYICSEENKCLKTETFPYMQMQQLRLQII